MSLNTQRIEYLDLIKGISIILVVFCHFVLISSDSILGNIVMAAAWGAVPCFFFVSGGLLHISKEFHWKKYIIRFIRTYFVLVIWKLIYFILCSKIHDVFYTKSSLFEFLFLFESIDGVQTGVMWFMTAYLLVLLFFPISHFLFKGGKDGKKIMLFSICLLFIYSYLVTAGNFIITQAERITNLDFPNINLQPVFPFGAYTNMLFFFLAGAFLFQYREWIKSFLQTNWWRRMIPLFLIIIGILGLLFVKWCENGTIHWEGIYIDSGYYRLPTVFLAFGIYLQALCIQIKKAGHFIANYIGKNTLGIYYTHYIILFYLSEKLYPYLTPYKSFTANIIKTVVLVFLCLLLTLIMKKIPLIKRLVL